MEETVEGLEDELQKELDAIEIIAAQVQKKEIDAFEGFMQSEKHKNRVVELGYKLKELGIDITAMPEYN